MKQLNNPVVISVVAIAGIIVTLFILEHSVHMFPIPPHIKNLIWVVFIMSGAALFYIYLQPKIKPAPHAHDHKKLKEGDTRQGIVIVYGSNRIGDIDKLLLKSDHEKIWLHFPPHTAKQVMNIAAKGATIHGIVRATNRKAGDDLPLYDLIAVQTSATTLHVDEIKPSPPANGKEVQVSGTVVQFKLDERGLVSGFIIDKYIVDIPPHTAQNIVPLIKQAKEISVKGYERSLEDGFVNATGFVLIKPYAITIDKTDYLL